MIKPTDMNIRGILQSDGVTYSIPKYQRNFDWGVDQLRELWSDLKETPNDQKLYLGTIILKEIGENSKQYEIVDGQQRLTTISLILIALREQAKKLNDQKLALEIHGFILTDSIIDNISQTKISVAENINKLFNYISNYEWDGDFKDTIDGISVKKQLRKIKPIYNYIEDNIDGFNSDELKRFVKSIFNAYAIVLIAEKDEDVFSIFERTNARGLDLNIGDLLKNYIFSYRSENDNYESTWNNIILNSSGSLQRMLKYFWVSRKGHIKNKELYVKLKEYSNKTIGMDQFIEELEKFSIFYKTMVIADRNQTQEWFNDIELDHIANNQGYFERINRVFQALKLFNITQAYPLVFSIIYSYKKLGQTNQKILFNAIEAIEKYHFINSVICGKVGNEVEKFYADKSKFFYNLSNNFQEEINKFLDELRIKKAKKEEFSSNYSQSISYSQKNIPLINYVFDKLINIHKEAGQRIEVFAPDKELSYRNYNIEHILPQKAKSKDNNEIIDEIGNLLILPRHTNSKLGDKNPKEKFKMIKEEGLGGNLNFYIDKIINDYANVDWDTEAIKNRSETISNTSYLDVWNF